MITSSIQHHLSINVIIASDMQQALAGSSPSEGCSETIVYLQVVAQVVGEVPLPWEEKESARQLLRGAGMFRAPVLSLLERDPDSRPTIAAFMQRCSTLLSSTTRSDC